MERRGGAGRGGTGPGAGGGGRPPGEAVRASPRFPRPHRPASGLVSPQPHSPSRPKSRFPASRCCWPFSPPTARAEPPPPSGSRADGGTDVSLGRLGSQTLLPPARPARLPFLTLSSSPPAEAVVTTAINAVVVAALSTPRPQLGPLNPTRRPPRLGREAERTTGAAKNRARPCVFRGGARISRRRAGAAAAPHVHTGLPAPARSRQPDPPPRCDLSPRPPSAPARRPPPAQAH